MPIWASRMTDDGAKMRVCIASVLRRYCVSAVPHLGHGWLAASGASNLTPQTRGVWPVGLGAFSVREFGAVPLIAMNVGHVPASREQEK
mmetsp:Transcript_23537/g.41586  ORF Transcript_23537/g.41586 Transcript_23537/m.41586 type:complete len:89 (+) Transcript_23537:249-515(+)